MPRGTNVPKIVPNKIMPNNLCHDRVCPFLYIKFSAIPTVKSDQLLVWAPRSGGDEREKQRGQYIEMK